LSNKKTAFFGCLFLFRFCLEVYLRPGAASARKKIISRRQRPVFDMYQHASSIASPGERHHNDIFGM
jgi:hypothetical protein